MIDKQLVDELSSHIGVVTYVLFSTTILGGCCTDGLMYR